MVDRRSEIAIAAMAVMSVDPKMKVAKADQIAEAVVLALFGQGNALLNPRDVPFWPREAAIIAGEKAKD